MDGSETQRESAGLGLEELGFTARQSQSLSLSLSLSLSRTTKEDRQATWGHILRLLDGIAKGKASSVSVFSLEKISATRNNGGVVYEKGRKGGKNVMLQENAKGMMMMMMMVLKLRLDSAAAATKPICSLPIYCMRLDHPCKLKFWVLQAQSMHFSIMI